MLQDEKYELQRTHILPPQNTVCVQLMKRIRYLFFFFFFFSLFFCFCLLFVLFCFGFFYQVYQRVMFDSCIYSNDVNVFSLEEADEGRLVARAHLHGDALASVSGLF